MIEKEFEEGPLPPVSCVLELFPIIANEMTIGLSRRTDLWLHYRRMGLFACKRESLRQVAMKLSELKPFETARITRVEVDSQRVALRLADFGLQKGRAITCLFRSPLGGVASYQLSHGVFAIEDHIIKNIEVAKESET